MMKKLNAILQLIRPANIVTSMADILAGFGIAAVPAILQSPDELPTLLVSLLFLLLSTSGLYGGGVAFNDVFDARLDQIERPERPIPSGSLSKGQAIGFASGLLLFGILMAFLVNPLSGLLAILIALLTLVYDACTKPLVLLGSFNMGLCRAFNLLLGISIIPKVVMSHWWLMFIPFIFVSAITFISKGEVWGNNKNLLWAAFLLYSIVIMGLLLLGRMEDYSLLSSAPYLAILSYFTLKSIIRAIQKPQPEVIKKAVKTGILCLILLDATLASGYAGAWYGLIILLLLPLSISLAKKFAVT